MAQKTSLVRPVQKPSGMPARDRPTAVTAIALNPRTPQMSFDNGRMLTPANYVSQGHDGTVGLLAFSSCLILGLPSARNLLAARKEPFRWRLLAPCGICSSPVTDEPKHGLWTLEKNTP